MPTNNFLPFTPVDSGTNLLSQSDYAASSGRTAGNQPGIASSKLNNKAIRQATYVVGQVAEYLAQRLNNDILDDALPAKLFAQIDAVFNFRAPVVTTLTGTGTWNKTFYFGVASANATAGATYTNNSNTFTVKTTIASGIVLSMTGDGDPTVSGTLTKTSGTGDATIIFYSIRSCIYLRARGCGGGGQGGGSSTTVAANGGTGGDGGDTTFGSTLFVGHKGLGGPGGSSSTGGAGGTASLGAGVLGLALKGNRGGASQQSSTASLFLAGGIGGSAGFGGGTGGGAGNASGDNATDFGSGGGGAGSPGSGVTGAGGGGGGSFDGILYSPAASYAYVIGAGGSGAGGGGSGGFGGGTGGAGTCVITEYFQ